MIKNNATSYWWKIRRLEMTDFFKLVTEILTDGFFLGDEINAWRYFFSRVQYEEFFTDFVYIYLKSATNLPKINIRGSFCDIFK